jgi:hypothetical protein
VCAKITPSRGRGFLLFSSPMHPSARDDELMIKNYFNYNNIKEGKKDWTIYIC